MDLPPAKIAGLPIPIDIKRFLPVIANQLSDEMLESLANAVVFIASDIMKMSEAPEPQKLLDGENLKVENEIISDEILESETLENETIADTTGLQSN